MKLPIEQLKSSLQKYEYVSFDLFDTLLFRTVSSPNLIFEMVSGIYKLRYGDHIPDFPRKRIKAEGKARSKRIGGEVDIDFIYSFIPYSEKDKLTIKEIEKECEINNCVPNVPMVNLANWCYECGKTVIITTDMYLDCTTIKAILQKIGVIYHHLIISSEEGVTKRSGKLFRVLLNKLDIHAKDIVHIGDDPHNDLDMAKANNIESHERICNETIRKTYIRSPRESFFLDHMLSLIEQRSRGCKDASSYRIGYSVLGPLMYDYCNWVHSARKEYNLDKLVFVAREGFLIKQCYEKMFPDEKDSVLYMSLNKNLLRLPMLDMGNLRESFIESLPFFETLDWDVLFDILMVEDVKSIKIQLKKEFPEVNFIQPLNREQFYDGSMDDVLIKIIEKQEDAINKQKDLLYLYLQQNGLINSRIGLVNNSIKGSGQRCIEEFLKKQGDKFFFMGLQFVASKKCRENLNGKFVSYLDARKVSGFFKSEFIRFCLIFEHLLFEPAATAKRFVSDSGKVNVLNCEMVKESENHEFVGMVQKYALEFVRDYQQYIPLPLGVFPVGNYLEMMHNPYIEDARLIGNLYDDDINGSNQLVPKIQYMKKYSFAYDLPNSIKWAEGFIKVKTNNNLSVKLIKYRMLEAYLRHNFIDKIVPKS